MELRLMKCLHFERYTPPHLVFFHNLKTLKEQKLVLGTLPLLKGNIFILFLKHLELNDIRGPIEKKCHKKWKKSPRMISTFLNFGKN